MAKQGKMLRQFWRVFLNTKYSIERISGFKDSDQVVSVAIGYSDTEGDQIHCGILYKHQGNTFLLHLAWHNILLNNQECDWFFQRCPDLFFVPLLSELPIEKLKVLSSTCKLIHDRHHEEGIPYGIRFGKQKFTPEGLLDWGKGKTCGLTCATFVMAVFRAAGINLAHTKFWWSRLSDRRWHGKIMADLSDTSKTRNISAEHLQNVEKEKWCSRFRPEEVAAMTTKKKLPSNFFHASISGAYIVDQLQLEKELGLSNQ